MEKTAAILLRRVRFSETSLICVWLTRDHAKIRTAARGALRPGSPFAGKLDLFFEAEIAFARARRGEVHALREVALLQPFDGCGPRYANLSVAAYFADLVDRATESEGAVAELFDLLRRAVGYLRTESPRARAITHFEAEMCRALGIADAAGRTDPLAALAGHCGRLPASRQRALRACG